MQLDSTLSLGFESMDKNHSEFLEILEKLQHADKASFLQLFEQMIEHTKEHFKYEENLMQKHEFYGYAEHKDEHENLLGEMEYFYEKSKKMKAFGLSYVNEYAFDKFKRHVINIDSQLAMFLKKQK